jgi:DNA-binding response OmpR family regulator
VYTSGGLVVDDNAKTVTVYGESIRLTPIEYKILAFLAKNKGKVYSIDQIYENIWGDISVRTDNTIAVHIRHIREKIEVDPREPKFLKVVWGVGYKIEEDVK